MLITSLLISFLLQSSLADDDPTYTTLNSQYAAIIDAGSSGSRIRLYRWKRLESNGGLPNITEIHSYSKNPGVSEFANDLVALKAYIKDLLDNATALVPPSLYTRTDIYFMATAGMRLLLEGQANEVVDFVDKMLADKSINPLKYLSPDNSRILSGEEEGVFAWITVNYLNNYFNNKENASTYGVMEMGGASMQLTFEHRGSILAAKFPVSLNDVTYPLYAHSYLNYGQNAVDLWVKTQLVLRNNQSTVSDPCMLQDHTVSLLINEQNTTFSGSGDPDKCLTLLKELVFKEEVGWQCSPKPCSIGDTYQPTIKNTTKFFAIGTFYNVLSTIGALGANGSLTPKNAFELTFVYCKKNYKDLVAADASLKKYYSIYCLMGNFMPLLITRGFGFDNETKQIFAPKKINGQEPVYPLGGILYELELKRSTVCSSAVVILSNHPLFLLLILILSKLIFANRF